MINYKRKLREKWNRFKKKLKRRKKRRVFGMRQREIYMILIRKKKGQGNTKKY